MHAAEDRRAFLEELAGTAHQAIRILATLDKPVIAAVKGSAAGAGLSLVLLADVVLTTSRTSFVTAYTSVGLTPDCGQSWLLPRAVGTGRALELMLRSRPVLGDEAVALGIATSVVEQDELDDEAAALARRLASRPTTALGAARELIRSSFDQSLDEHLDKEASTIARMAGTEETGRLIDAFVAQRT